MSYQRVHNGSTAPCNAIRVHHFLQNKVSGWREISLLVHNYHVVKLPHIKVLLVIMHSQYWLMRFTVLPQERMSVSRSRPGGLRKWEERTVASAPAVSLPLPVLFQNPYTTKRWLNQRISLSLSLTHTHTHRIESKHEVTILGGLNEFIVKFFGPSGSKSWWMV